MVEEGGLVFKRKGETTEESVRKAVDGTLKDYSKTMREFAYNTVEKYLKSPGLLEKNLKAGMPLAKLAESINDGTYREPTEKGYTPGAFARRAEQRKELVNEMKSVLGPEVQYFAAMTEFEARKAVEKVVPKKTRLAERTEEIQKPKGRKEVETSVTYTFSTGPKAGSMDKYEITVNTTKALNKLNSDELKKAQITQIDLTGERTDVIATEEAKRQLFATLLQEQLQLKRAMAVVKK